MKTINHVGGYAANVTPRTLVTDFSILDSVSGPASILSVTVDGTPVALDETTPMPDATTVRLAAAPPEGSTVSITHKSVNDGTV